VATAPFTGPAALGRAPDSWVVAIAFLGNLHHAQSTGGQLGLAPDDTTADAR